MKNIQAQDKYIIYKLNGVMGNNTYQALTELEFDSISNYFDSEKEAIDALIKEERIFDDVVILKVTRFTFDW